MTCDWSMIIVDIFMCCEVLVCKYVDLSNIFSHVYFLRQTFSLKAYTVIHITKNRCWKPTSVSGADLWCHFQEHVCEPKKLLTTDHWHESTEALSCITFKTLVKLIQSFIAWNSSRPILYTRHRTWLTTAVLSPMLVSGGCIPHRAEHASWRLTRTFSTFGDRAFSAAGPGLWNSLPSHLKDADLSQWIPAVVKDISVWPVGPRCSVNFINCAD